MNSRSVLDAEKLIKRSNQFRDQLQTTAMARRANALKLKRSGMSLKQVGAIIGVSRQRVHAMVKKAIADQLRGGRS